MTKYKKRNGNYFIQGKTFKVLTGSRAQVYHGTAYKTTGGLTKNELFENKHGRFVSKKKHVTATREKRLLKHGYSAKKGKFGYVKVNGKTKGRKSRSRGRSRKMRGGGMYALSPSTYHGKSSNTPSVGVQFAAGNAG
jgi:hypothetical protein